MKEYISIRVLEVADYIIRNNSTIRQTAKFFSVSKSTIHKDLSLRLHYLDIERLEKIKKILDINLSTRHIRGGRATQQKYMKCKK
ncbi:MAG: sporulation transcriptional regulator SpoIIID [Clostridia bacterium]